jgi:hypothetical protein
VGRVSAFAMAVSLQIDALESLEIVIVDFFFNFVVCTIVVEKSGFSFFCSAPFCEFFLVDSDTNKQKVSVTDSSILALSL